MGETYGKSFATETIDELLGLLESEVIGFRVQGLGFRVLSRFLQDVVFTFFFINCDPNPLWDSPRGHGGPATN